MKKYKVSKRDLAYIRRLPDRGLRAMGRSRDDYGMTARIELKARGKPFRKKTRKQKGMFDFNL